MFRREIGPITFFEMALYWIYLIHHKTCPFFNFCILDNQKSYLPRVAQPGKKSSKIFHLPSKITGTIIWSSRYPHNRRVKMYVNHNNFEQGESKVILLCTLFNCFVLIIHFSKVVSVLYLLIKDFIKDNKDLPKVLHLNLDNCWR